MVVSERKVDGGQYYDDRWRMMTAAATSRASCSIIRKQSYAA